MLLIATATRESNTSKDYALVSFACQSHLREHKFNHVFKTIWIHVVHVALMLKLLCIFSFTIPCSVMKDAPSWVQLMILIVGFVIETQFATNIIKNWFKTFLSSSFHGPSRILGKVLIVVKRLLKAKKILLCSCWKLCGGVRQNWLFMCPY